MSSVPQQGSRNDDSYQKNLRLSRREFLEPGQDQRDQGKSAASVMNYAMLKKRDVADGIGVRVSLFVSGCTHHCKGCFNEETWDFDFGSPFDEAVEDEIIKALAPDYIRGLTVLGGEPMEKVNQRALLPFIKKSVRSILKRISGFTQDTPSTLNSQVRAGQYAKLLQNCFLTSTFLWTASSSRNRKT